MIVTLDQLRCLASGCADVRAEPEGVYFDRMTEPLRACYGGSEGAVIRARCPSGVRVRFASNTRFLKVAIRFGRVARPLDTIDLHVDGLRWGTFVGDRAAAPWRATLFRDVESRCRTFELALPHCVEAWLAELEIEDGAGIESIPPEPDTWLVIGDSISQGMTCGSPSRAYTATAARALALNHQNTAVGGAQMNPAAADTAAIPAAIATVLFGCNDWNVAKPLDRFEADSAAFLERFFAAHPRTPLGVITPIPSVRDGGECNKAGVALEAYRAVLRKLAPRYAGVQLIEGPSLVPADRQFFCDGIHPNNAGMAAIARALAPALSRLLAAR